MVHQTENVTTFKIEVEDGYREVFKAPSLGHESEYEMTILSKLCIMHVQTFPHHNSKPFAIVALVKNGSVGALNVDPVAGCLVRCNESTVST